MTRPEQKHVLRARLERVCDEADVVLSIECQSPEGAMCRVMCEQECESWDSEHEHPLISTDGICNGVEWMEAGESLHLSYVGSGSHPLHDGMAVEFVWEGDYYSWTVAGESS